METKVKIEPFAASELADAIPQKPPFRFLDKILSVNDDYIEGIYTFEPTEFFYQGHFPGNPVTPGVILLEAMAQVGLVSFGLYLLSKEFARADMVKLTTFFTEANVEFLSPISPGETIRICGEKKMWRRKKIRTHTKAWKADGTLACAAELAGIGAPI